MRLMACDLSTTRTGIAIYDDGKLTERFSIVPKHKDDHPYEKIKDIATQLYPHMLTANNCVIEGIFLNTFAKGMQNVVGFETLARLSGVIVYLWMMSHDNIPVLFKATEARKLAGIKGTCQKAEVQIFIATKFGVATEEQIHTFQAMIEAENAQLNEDEIKKATWKKHMDQISTYIEGETGLGEDEADAVLLGLAYLAAQNSPK